MFFFYLWKFSVVGIYLSTRLTKSQGEKVIDLLSTTVAKIKTAHDNPIVLVAGDFNGVDHSQLLDDYDDLVLHQTPPTRGNRTIDLSLIHI